MKVLLSIAPFIFRVAVIFILGTKTFLRCPGLYQGVIGAEMIFTEQVSFTRQLNHFFKQRGNDVVLRLQKAVAVFAKDGVVPYLIIDTEANKPAKQQIVADLRPTSRGSLRMV